MTDPNSTPRVPSDPLAPGGTTPMPPTTPRHGSTTAGGEQRTEHATSPDGGAGSPDGSAREKAEHVASSAKEQAADLAGTAKGAAGSVMDAEKTMAKDTTAEATDRAKATLSEAKVQVKDLWQQSRGELTEGAGVQLQRLSAGARSLSDELGEMATASDDPGIASDLARRASDYLASASDWLEDRGPEEVFADVKQFARRSPGTFIALAAGLGVVVGRVGRSLKDDASTDRDPADAHAEPHAWESSPGGLSESQPPVVSRPLDGGDLR